MILHFHYHSKEGNFSLVFLASFMTLTNAIILLSLWSFHCYSCTWAFGKNRNCQLKPLYPSFLKSNYVFFEYFILKSDTVIYCNPPFLIWYLYFVWNFFWKTTTTVGKDFVYHNATIVICSQSNLNRSAVQ